MAYEKLTLARFLENVKQGGVYAGLTGARRAIGKSSWTTSDKEQANAIATKLLGDSVPVAAAAKSTRKVQTPRTPRVPRQLMKAAKKQAHKPPKEDKAVRQPRATAAAILDVEAFTSTLKEWDGRSGDPSATTPETTTRQNAAAAMASAIQGIGRVTPRTELAFDYAIEEYILGVSPGARAVVASQLRRPVTGGRTKLRDTEDKQMVHDETDHPVPALAGEGRIQLPQPGAPAPHFETEDDRKAWEAVQEAAAATNALNATGKKHATA